MTDSSFPNPASSISDPLTLTFEEAIAQTQALLDRLEHGSLSEAELEQEIAQLVQTQNGARGFFVTYLSDERAIADEPTPAVTAALQSSPETVSELLVKNVAMSSAMAIAHRRNENEDLARGSDRVRSRSLVLIQQLNLPEIQTKANALRESSVTGVGAYQAFLTRWGYDAEQRQAIAEAMALVAVEA